MNEKIALAQQKTTQLTTTRRFATARRWLTLFTSTCQRRPPCKRLTQAHAHINATHAQLVRYIRGKVSSFTVVCLNVVRSAIYLVKLQTIHTCGRLSPPYGERREEMKKKQKDGKLYVILHRKEYRCLIPCPPPKEGWCHKPY